MCGAWGGRERELQGDTIAWRGVDWRGVDWVVWMLWWCMDGWVRFGGSIHPFSHLLLPDLTVGGQGRRDGRGGPFGRIEMRGPEW